MSADRVRVVLATRTLLAFTPTWRAATLAVAELGSVAFFASGIAEAAIGPTAPWFLLAAVLLGAFVRAVDVEARGLFVRGGVYGLVRQALGEVPGRIAGASLLVERILLGSLAAAVVGRYAVAMLRASASPNMTQAAAENLAVGVAVGLLVISWIGQRSGRVFSNVTISRAIVAATAVLAAVMLWGVLTIVREGGSLPPLPFWPDAPDATMTPIGALLALGSVLFVIGGVDALSQIAPELEPPRIRNLQRAARVVTIYALATTAVVGFLTAAVVPEDMRKVFADTPLAALAFYGAGPAWLRLLLMAAVAAGVALMMGGAARNAFAGAHIAMTRMVDEGLLPYWLRALHPRFGTP